MKAPRILSLAVTSSAVLIAVFGLRSASSTPGARVATSASAALAAVPPAAVHYQSRLLDNLGNPITQNGLEVTFTIWDDEFAGVALHTETQTLNLIDGFLNTKILVPDAAFGSGFPDIYLGVKVENDSEMAPRMRILSVPFALRAAQAQSVAANSTLTPKSIDIDGGLIMLNDGNGAFAGNIAAQGNLSADGNGFIGGMLNVGGTLTKGSGSFMIDHPLDPEHKYLLHSFVESPDMMNVYNGNVTLDEQGEAVVELPEWFDALNRDFRYQLTCIGGFAPVYVADPVADNRFRIAGGIAGLRVSWQVTGIREDPFARMQPIPTEMDKQEQDVGRYLHPEAYGLPPSMGLTGRP